MGAKPNWLCPFFRFALCRQQKWRDRSLLDPLPTYTLLKRLQAVTGGACDRVPIKMGACYGTSQTRQY
jgi:hypothetical protein